MSTRYIELVSSRRNRTQFPLPSTFEVPLNKDSNLCYNRYRDAVDPVSDNAPSWIFYIDSIIPYDTQRFPNNFKIGLYAFNTQPQLDPTGPAPYGTQSIVDKGFSPQAWWQSQPVVQNNLYRIYETTDGTKGYLIQDRTINSVRQIISQQNGSVTTSVDYPFPPTLSAGDIYNLTDGSNTTTTADISYNFDNAVNTQPYDMFGRKAPITDDFFTESWLVLDNTRSTQFEPPSYQKITKFNPDTQKVRVASQFTSTYGQPIVFSIRENSPSPQILGSCNNQIIAFGGIGSASGNTIVSATPLTPLINGQDPGYEGTYIYIKPDPEDPITYVNYPTYPVESDVNQIQRAYIYRVVRYPANDTLILDRKINLADYWSNTLTPVNEAQTPIIRPFEILPVSYDNFAPLNYNGSVVSQDQQSCYEISLSTLILPNQLLTAGGKIAYYPFVYVKLENVTSSNYNTVLYTNSGSDQKKINPYGSEACNTALFVVPIVNIIRFASISPFVRLSGSGITQTIKFKPNDALRFTVFLPNGSLFETVYQDTINPLAPNPLLQISATFAINKL